MQFRNPQLSCTCWTSLDPVASLRTIKGLKGFLLVRMWPHFTDLIFASVFCLTVYPVFQEAEVRAMAKERQKKDNHNLSELVHSLFLVFKSALWFVHVLLI